MLVGCCDGAATAAPNSISTLPRRSPALFCPNAALSRPSLGPSRPSPAPSGATLSFPSPSLGFPGAVLNFGVPVVGCPRAGLLCVLSVRRPATYQAALLLATRPPPFPPPPHAPPPTRPPRASPRLANVNDYSPGLRRAPGQVSLRVWTYCRPAREPELCAHV